MKKLFSNSWSSSAQPRKQRKYIHNAPVHVRGKFLACHFSKSLRNEFGRRAARVTKGDKVKILRGDFRGVSGVVLRVDAVDEKVYLKEASRKKVSGAEVQLGIHPSNIMITEPETKDQRRVKAFRRGKKQPEEKKRTIEKVAKKE